jgi:hypothetical protein
MRIFFGFLFLIGLYMPVTAQEKKTNFLIRYIKKFTGDSTAKSKPQNLIFPSINYAPETKWRFGGSAVIIGYANRDTNNRLSEITALGFVTSLKQYGGIFEHSLYSNKNRWFFSGLLKAQSFPFSYHGIGYDSPIDKIAVIDAFSFNLRERFLRKVRGNFYMGLQLDFQRLSRVNLISYTDNSQLLTPTGYTGYNNLGIGAGFLFDNRHNVFNVRKGFYAEIAMLNYRRAFGANNNFSSIFTDLRVFYPIRKRNILTFQSLGQFTLGDAPFNQYALMGGEMMMRGYYLGRFRDKHFLSIQSEYRMLPLSFAKKFGLAVFASAGMVYNNESKITNQYLKYAGGAGVHYLLFPKKDVWTRLDMAVNNEGGTGLYLSIGCAF